MRVLTATFVLFVIWFSSPFDQYGEIEWEHEKARLDNFAIRLQEDWKGVGAILIFDKAHGCSGEAKARAVRAKRYMVEHRGIPWNRVFWRHEGYARDITTTLLTVPLGAYTPYPFYEVRGPQVDGPMTRACRVKLDRIRRSRW